MEQPPQPADPTGQRPRPGPAPPGDQGSQPEDPQDAAVVRLDRWDGAWDEADVFAGLKADVAAYSHSDPLATLHTMSESTGIPVGALVRYVLARWVSGGAEALLELGTSGVARLRRTIEEAEAAGTDEARREAYEVLRAQVSWLAEGIDDPEHSFPAGGARPQRRLRLGVYGVIVDPQQRMLLTRLAPGRPHEGMWTLPGGGLDHGEEPRAGVRREIHEETGLEARVGQLLEVDTRHVDGHRTSDDQLVDVHTVRLLFQAEVDHSLPPRVVEVDGSTDAVRWVPRDELDEVSLVDLARHGAHLAGLLPGAEPPPAAADDRRPPHPPDDCRPPHPPDEDKRPSVR